ncbi:hypothetical protein SERLA73DRAFT_142645 [Serpula lacrymans var. lacrymans S7.3]|uniref:Uncharacterized protein n=1 Tax=Serpula lacrymans var. lacrymans (strain S7.3) TaxID=936435 RepID=F8Q854_SERL3|nr:hypothetical protein SERLA73DRAFT_142645 [Serpula lacrymans var. lacrymans S7.3]
MNKSQQPIRKTSPYLRRARSVLIPFTSIPGYVGERINTGEMRARMGADSVILHAYNYVKAPRSRRVAKCRTRLAIEDI